MERPQKSIMNAEKKWKAAPPSFHSEDLYGYVSPERHPFRSQSQIDATDSEKDIDSTRKYTNAKKLSAFGPKLRRKSSLGSPERRATGRPITIRWTEHERDSDKTSLSQIALKL